MEFDCNHKTNMRRIRVLQPLIKRFQVSVILILIVCSLSVASLFAAAFLWSVKTGQFDDPESNAVRILIDGTDIAPKSNNPSSEVKPSNVSKQS